MATAVRNVERAVSLRDVLRRDVSESFGGTIYCGWTAFKFQECANRGLIKLNFQVVQIFQDVGGSEFFITERWMQVQGAQDSAHFFGVGYFEFEFLFDFVAILLFRLAERRWLIRFVLGRAFIGKFGLDAWRFAILTRS